MNGDIRSIVGSLTTRYTTVTAESQQETALHNCQSYSAAVH